MINIATLADFADVAHAARVNVHAKLAEESSLIQTGIKWRVFSTAKNAQGNLTKLHERNIPQTFFELQPGTYLIHATYGDIGLTKQIEVKEENIIEEFILNAGGVKLNATAGNNPIEEKYLKFTIFSREVNENEERELIKENIKANKIVQLKEGTYHVLSTYGDINTSVRADIEVRAAQLTSAILQHHGAKITIRLVSRPGGAPIANTAWTIFTNEGEQVFESNQVSPEIVLAEGIYQTSVQNGDNTYTQEFEVKAGENQEIELLIAN